MPLVKRSSENPVLVPNSQLTWEAEATFNGCPTTRHGKIILLYRAISSQERIGDTELQISSVGYANSTDGIHFKNRRQLIKPEYEWERFGCEDPRVTKLGNKYFIFYTALSQYPFTANGIRIGLAITKDLKSIQEKHLVTPFNAKAMAMFPEKINGKIAAVLTANTDKPPSRIGIAMFNSEKEIWSKNYWDKWYKELDKNSIAPQRTSYDHVEVGAQPIKTRYGWLLIYSHIHNYFRPPPVFGIEALLLDLDDPLKIIARTDTPLLVPQEEYEKYGRVPNIVFPSGALLNKQNLNIYYGATDTTCNLATVKINDLLREMFLAKVRSLKLKRSSENPILEPEVDSPWESKALFNAAAIYLGKKTHLIYRAMSEDNTSVFGYASSNDGVSIQTRLPQPAYVPREEFEKKSVPGANSGCEDPRITKIGGKIYMCYTAFDGKGPPRVALTSITEKNFLARRWGWTKPILISPPNMDDKDAALFPKKIKGKYVFLHRLDKSIWIDFVDSLKFGNGKWLKGKVLMSPRPGERDSRKIGIAGPPIETEAGWLLLYHGISKKDNHHYHLRAAILDLKNPTKVIARTKDTIFEPETHYEKEGLVPNVVFSCGAVVMNGKLFVYYGGADKVLGVATIKLADLFDKFIAERMCK